MTLRYETETGIGYFEDDEGRVIDYYDVEPGQHMAGGVRESAIDVGSIDDLPEIDEYYRGDLEAE